MTSPSKSAKSESASAEKPAAPKRSAPRAKWKRWAFRLAAVALAGVFLLVVEGFLIAFGVGSSSALVIPVAGEPEILKYQFNPRAERIYFAGREVSGPEPRRFEIPKPEGTYRIVVVGASTVLGFPYPPELAFPRQLEVLLNRQDLPFRVEVLNTGIVGINSFSVADVLRQSLEARPDLIIVHAGHNEFYGPGGVASTMSAPRGIYPLILRIQRSRIFQLVAAAIPKASQSSKNLIEELPESVTIALDDPLVQKAEQSYRANLEKMVQTAKTAGVPIVLTTVASNLAGHSPVSFLVPEDLDAATGETWRAFFDRGRQLASKESYAEALDALTQAEEISSESSLLHFRKGECLSALGRYDEATTAFSRARDLDGCRFRAPSSFAGIARHVAVEQAAAEVHFIDTAKQLAKHAGPEPLGSSLYLEHVHYNLEGHFLLARVLAEGISREVLQESWDENLLPAPEEMDELLGILPEDRLSGLSYALRLMGVFPMAETFDAGRHQKRLMALIREELGRLEPPAQKVFADLSLDDMALRLPQALGDHYRKTNQPERERFYRRIEVRRRPWDAEAHFRLARCLAETGQASESRRSCRKSLELRPDSADAQALLKTLPQDKDSADR